MRFILLISLLLPTCLQAQLVARIPGPGGLNAAGAGAWSVVQHTYFNSTPGCNGTATCSITVSSTGSGHVLVLEGSLYNNVSHLTLSSISGGGTWVQCNACTEQFTPSAGIYFDNIVGYVMSSSSGTTSVTMNISANATYWSLEFTELALSAGTPYYYTGGATGYATASCNTTCVGPSLTLNGTNAAVLQMAATVGAVSSISGGAGYSLDLDYQSFGFAYAVNTNNGTGPTWTVSPAGSTAVSAIAFSTTAPGGTTPTLVQGHACNVFSSPGTCTMTVSGGNNIFYNMASTGASATYTVTNNCAGSFTTDVGPTAYSTFGSSQSGHAAGASAGSCTVSVTYTDGGSGILTIAEYTGSGALDVVAAYNNGSLSSNAVTAGANDLCLGYTTDFSGTSSTLTAGSGWTIPSGGSINSTGVEWKQPAAGSVTATFTSNVGTLSQTGLSCVKP